MAREGSMAVMGMMRGVGHEYDGSDAGRGAAGWGSCGSRYTRLSVWWPMKSREEAGRPPMMPTLCGKLSTCSSWGKYRGLACSVEGFRFEVKKDSHLQG